MTCPSCGYCPHCGRSNMAPYRAYPYWQWLGGAAGGVGAGTGALPLTYVHPAPNAAQGAGDLSHYRSVDVTVGGGGGGAQGVAGTGCCH